MRRGKVLRDHGIHNPSAAAPVEGKEMAVRMILTRNASRAELARDLGVSQSTLSNWVRDAIDHAPYGDVLASLHEEVGTLRKDKAALEKVLRARLG
jgi:transposase-like protein